MKSIDQMHPCFDEAERIALNEYMIQGGWVTEFKKTREFESMIATYTGAQYCSVVSNGTVSLSIALMACGIGVGDEVLVPDFTMVATPNSAELIGAKAIFVDIDRETLCMDFALMKKAYTSRTKAVILVSINGRYPENIQEYRDFCDSKGIYLIEDAAQSLGSRVDGRHLGRYGHIGSFSFSAPKIITTGQGGALITEDEELYNRIKRIRDFGRDCGGSDHYLCKGWNFKFTDVQAVIGIEQMKKMDYRVRRKKEMGERYTTLLKDVDGVELLKTNFDNTSPWFFDILCEDRSGLIKYLKQAGIGSREFYPALHLAPAYGLINLTFPVSEEIARKGLWLPSAIDLKNEEIDFICDSIKDYYS